MTTHWSYRLIRHAYAAAPSGEYLEIAEVYYDGERPSGYCSASVGGDDVAEIRRVLAMLADALTHPPIRAESFEPVPDVEPPRPASPRTTEAL
jgi:hypothetical protein